MKVVVFGATGTIGQALVPVLAREHDVVAVSRSGAPRRRAASRGRAPTRPTPRRCAPRSRAPTSPTTSCTRSDRPTSSERDREAAETVAREASARGPAADRLPRRPRRRLARSLAAPAQPHRDRRGARIRQRAGDDAARRDGRRRRQRGVRDDPRARRPPARDDLPALGLDADAADRARRRRRATSPPSAAASEPYGESFDVGGPEVMTYREMIEQIGRAARPPPADRRGAGADAAPLVLLAAPRHARRREGRAAADRGPAHGDDRARRPHPRADPDRADAVRRSGRAGGRSAAVSGRATAGSDLQQRGQARALRVRPRCCGVDYSPARPLLRLVGLAGRAADDQEARAFGAGAGRGAAPRGRRAPRPRARARRAPPRRAAPTSRVAEPRRTRYSSSWPELASV